MPNPANKKRSDGKLTGGKDVQRQAKVYKATGKVVRSHKEVGSGTEKLSARRLRGWLFGGDE